MKALYIDCFSGAAGDMLVGALLDCGVPLSVVTDSVRLLDIEGVNIGTTSVMKGGLRATAFTVEVSGPPVQRNYRDIVGMLDSSTLPPNILRRSLEAFAVLARGEAKIHGASMDDVHFHEVGSVDAIVDIVGACAALDHLGPEKVVVSPVSTGRGFTESAHGTIPIPAPAVLEILSGATLKELGTSELITPTGAALLASWADSFGPMPPMRLGTIGHGAGSADLEWPNVVRVIVGDATEEANPHISTELLETNIDDMSPELLPYVIERVLEAGALDAWATPVHMKKGRIGVVLSVLVERGASGATLDVIFKETTTFGIRISPVAREILDRKVVDVEVEGSFVRVKLGYRDGLLVSSAPEYEDVARVARVTGLPLKDVYRAALDAVGATFL